MLSAKSKLSLMSAALLLGSTTAALASDFVARGNEPGWIIRKSEHDLTFQTMLGPAMTISPVPTAREIENGAVYETTFDNQPFRLTVTDKVCVDTMSGMNFPASVEVLLGGDRFAGCGGEPLTLLRGEWTVEEIKGEPVVKGSAVTLNFEDDGNVSGSASCNRYFGTFTLTGESLTLSKAGASMMICEEVLMDQERGFLDALATTNHFSIGADGRLTLLASDRPSITAVRKTPADAESK